MGDGGFGGGDGGGGLGGGEGGGDGGGEGGGGGGELLGGGLLGGGLLPDGPTWIKMAVAGKLELRFGVLCAEHTLLQSQM